MVDTFEYNNQITKSSNFGYSVSLNPLLFDDDLTKTYYLVVGAPEFNSNKGVIYKFRYSDNGGILLVWI